MREITLTEENIYPIDEVLKYDINGRGILNFVWWREFGANEYFDTHDYVDGDAVDFITHWYRDTGEMKAFYVILHSDHRPVEEYEWMLTNEEQELLKRIQAKYVGMELDQYFDSYDVETSTVNKFIDGSEGVFADCYLVEEHHGVGKVKMEPRDLWVDGSIKKEQIIKAEQCLVDNGIDPAERDSVLQTLGYILLDVDLYEIENKIK